MTYHNNQYAADIEAKAKTNYIPGMAWEDIAQELDLGLWLGLPKYRGRNGANERTFAQTIMRNRLIDLKKAAYRHKRLADAHSLCFSELEATESGRAVLERLGLI